MGSINLALPLGHIACRDDSNQPTTNREDQEKWAPSVRLPERIEAVLHRGMHIVVGQHEWLVEKGFLRFASRDAMSDPVLVGVAIIPLASTAGIAESRRHNALALPRSDRMRLRRAV